MNVLLGKVAGFGKPQAHILVYLYLYDNFCSPPNLCVFMKRKSTGQYSLRSLYSVTISVSKVGTEIGIRSFWFSDPVAWNLPLIAFK